MASAGSLAPVSRSASHRQGSAPPPQAASPHRSHSQSYRQPAPSPNAQGGLVNTSRRDYEQSNLAQPDMSDRLPPKDKIPSRSESTRVANTQPSSRSDHARYASVDTGTATRGHTNGVANDHAAQRPHASHSASHASQSSSQPHPGAGKRRTSLQTSTGNWALGKTVGAGSMGKVKLAKNMSTGEQAAIKIVPRQSTDEHKTQADKERADHSKEIRTAREAAIVSLVNHPYICGMRDFVRTNFHWYMLFEYVNGGQMLDYIISHGRLKEKPARKFARQIASALDYCHRNSIVHRDLKIENILISKTGDIKIIDFGLSNLFSPTNYLKTFCGSLYFAAPELLQARQYTGPEVDLWSFGIVLYVLVCGKVPFDDQSMPQLHAKIKKGVVEYPPWLSQECKNLISRMLVTDPKQRATLSEIMSHPWMTKGFSGPPENFLPHREPLQLPLDPRVIEKMHGFDFGEPEVIREQLTKVIESEEYQRVVKLTARRNAAHTPETERKRGVFDFYKRRNSQTSRDNLTVGSSEQIPLGHDPVNAFSPLISTYFLAKEKLEREAQEANPGALAMPSTSAAEAPFKMPDLQAPAAAVTNSHAPEMSGEATGGRSRPRARTKGEDEIAANLKDMRLQPSEGVAAPQPAGTDSPRKEGPAAGLLRRLSTKRKPREVTPSETAAPTPPVVSISGPAEETSPTPPPMKRGFSVRRTRDRASPSSASLDISAQQRQQAEMLNPANAGNDTGAPKRFMSLRRSLSTDRRRLGRRGVSDSAGPSPPATSGSEDQYNMNEKVQRLQPSEAEERLSAQRPAAASRTKSLGHARRESIQARRARRAEANQPNVTEETDADLAKVETSGAGEDREEVMKPVYLKGLFSVRTTSSKPLPQIRSEIMRVLKLHKVDYTEIKGGFSCRHAPSINLDEGADSPTPLTPVVTQGAPEKSHRRKISFAGLVGGGKREALDPEKQQQQQQDEAMLSPSLTTRSSYRTTTSTSQNRGAAHDSGMAGTSESSGSEDQLSSTAKRRQRQQNRARNPGETSTHVREDVGESMTLKFEIFIVKVPLLSLHGIQFKKVDGNMMHYQNMAQEILKGLRL